MPKIFNFQKDNDARHIRMNKNTFVQETANYAFASADIKQDGIDYCPIDQTAIQKSRTDLFGRAIDRHDTAVREAARTTQKTWSSRQGKMITWPLIGQTKPFSDLLSSSQGGSLNAHSFDWSRYAHAFESVTPIAVYIATCDALCDLGGSAKLPITKIGVSERIDLVDRMEELNAVRYGSICRDALGNCQIGAGFDNWHPSRLPHSAKPLHDSPVEWTQKRLLVSLPNSLSTQDFDLALKKEIAASIVFNWASTSDGRLQCARADLDPRALQRYTAYTNDDGSLRISRCDEVYVFRSAQDPAILISIIESIILRHLMDTDVYKGSSGFHPKNCVPKTASTHSPSFCTNPEIAGQWPPVWTVHVNQG